jgi:ribosome-associated protein
MLRVTSTLVIEESELEERFVRSSGPGGQNVNKVATAVQLSFNPWSSPALDDGTRERLRILAGRRMTADGVLVIDARRYRTQADNRQDARDRLVALLRAAVIPPKRRRKTRPSAASSERRLTSKKRRSDTKRGRSNPVSDD